MVNRKAKKKLSIHGKGRNLAGRVNLGNIVISATKNCAINAPLKPFTHKMDNSIAMVAPSKLMSNCSKEIGIMKATGWNTLEVLEVISFEQLLISLLGATIAILLSILWVKGFNGAFIAQFFVAAITMLPKFTLPARFLPLPCILSFFFAFILTMVGSVYSSWRASTESPVVSMK